MPSLSPASSLQDGPKYNTQFESGSDDNETLWNVLQIVKESKNKYLVKWEGVDPATGKPWDLSWVPKHDCTNDLIHEWKVSEAKRRQSRKSLRKSKDDTYTNGAKANKRGASRSNTVSVASPVTGPPKFNASSGNDIAVTEIVQKGKRRRASHAFDGDFDVDDNPADVSKPRKKRKAAVDQSDVRSLSPGSNREAELPSRLGRLPSISSVAREHDELDAIHSTPSPHDPSHSPGHQRSETGLSHRKSRSRAPQTNEHSKSKSISGSTLSSRSQSRRAPKQDNLERSQSPALPSPHDLLVESSRSNITVVPETQSSAPVSQLKSHPTTPTELPSPHTDGKPKGNGRLAKDSRNLNNTFKAMSKRLVPVPEISPGTFETYVAKAKARAGSPQSQISSIDTFESPRKSQQAKRKAKSHDNGPIYPQQNGQESNSDNDFDSILHDPIEGYGVHPSERTLELRGAEIAEAARLRRSALEPSKPPKRPLRDFVSHKLNDAQSHDDDAESKELTLDAEADQMETHIVESNDNGRHISQSPTSLVAWRRYISNSTAVNKPSSRSRSLLIPPDESSGNHNQVDPDGSEVAELGFEDALDNRESAEFRATDVPSSAGKNYSLMTNAGLTQPFRLPVIASPVRELNHALGLLNRKSEEIELLKVSLKSHQARVAELNEEVLRLNRDSEAVEKRYEEVNTALKQERAAKASEEERAEEDSTAKDLTVSSVAHPDRFMELVQENEQLKHIKTQLESDTDMLRKLYAQASDAHQSLLEEIKPLRRDNDSLREQATTGVKQAQMVWSTQVHQLEDELARVRGVIEVLTDQARRTDNDVRQRAALFPSAQREAAAAMQEAEDWKTRFMELGIENTKLRLEVKAWEDETMMRRKTEQELKDRELKDRELKEREMMRQDELVWICPWMNNEYGSRCGAVLESRERLREHFYQAGHI